MLLGALPPEHQPGRYGKDHPPYGLGRLAGGVPWEDLDAIDWRGGLQHSERCCPLQACSDDFDALFSGMELGSSLQALCTPSRCGRHSDSTPGEDSWQSSGSRCSSRQKQRAKATREGVMPTEARLSWALLRHSLHGLAAAAPAPAAEAALEVAAAASPAANAWSWAEAEVSPPLPSLPGPPRWAPPALPVRGPSGDWAVDAAEELLAREVDPFGAREDCRAVAVHEVHCSAGL